MNIYFNEEVSETLNKLLKQKKDKSIDHNTIFQFIGRLSYPARFPFVQEVIAHADISKTIINNLCKNLSGPGRPIFYFETLDSLIDYSKISIAQTSGPTDEEIRTAIEKHLSKSNQAINNMATHVGKLINPQTDHIYYSPQFDTPAVFPYVCSQTIKAEKSHTIAGNFGRNFLEFEFFFKGIVTGFFKGISEKNSDMLQVLKELGLSKDDLDDLFVKINNHLKTIVSQSHVHDTLPQTFFPLNPDENAYVAITSLPAVSVSRGIRHRTRFRSDENTWIIKDEVKVGGTKAQNCGNYNLDCGGSHVVLKSGIPLSQRNESSLNRVIRSAWYHRSVFAVKGLSLKIFWMPLNSDWPNKRKQDYLHTAFEHLISSLLWMIDTIRDDLLSGSNPVAFREKLSRIPLAEIERIYLNSIVFRDPDVQSMDTAVRERLLSHIRNNLGKTKEVFDKERFDMFCEILTERLFQ